jgi:putative hydrolase of the HAD superfamily
MRTPKMILFDYGHTLLHEPGFDMLHGMQSLMPYVSKNPRNFTAEQINDFYGKLFNGIISDVRELGADFNLQNSDKLVYEYLQLEFSISSEEREQVLWDAVSYGAKMPNVEKMLAYLRKSKIRSGVISNIGWSGNALKKRIDRLLPNNNFEFIIASSEYIVRKPNPMIFELALHKADLSADEVWFCGDNVQCDVEGANVAGIFPVWYLNSAPDNFKQPSIQPSCKHLFISDWLELLDALKRTNSGLT